MESGQEVHIEDESIVLVNEVVKVKKDGENVDTNVKDSENSNKVEEVHNSSSLGVSESSENVNDTKSQTPIKIATNGDTSKNNKMTKNGPSCSTLARKPKPSVSQSLSFPAKTRNPDPMRTSVDGHHGKPRVVGSKGEASLSNVTVSSRLYSANRRGSDGVKPKEVSAKSGATSTRKAALDSGPSVRPSRPRISNGNEICPPSEDSLSVDHNSKPIKTALPVREDDDARSTTSSGQRRNSASGFSFRLDERAEKRREFFSKLEEKIHAKEVEKTNLQEKSKESQEAELRKLRKSLTFKAAPMPTFYIEPPPKVELKRIPTTRPKSPKLGRNKSSVAAVSKSLEGIGTALSPRVTRDQTISPKVNHTNRDKDTAASKKPTRKSQSKTPSSKTEIKPEKSNEKPAETEVREKEKACNEQCQESQSPSANPIEVEGWIEVNPEKNAADENGSPNQDTTPADVVVGG